MKLIKYPKNQVKNISEHVLENLRIDLTFYERQNYSTHTKKIKMQWTSAVISIGLLWILHYPKKVIVWRILTIQLYLTWGRHIKCTIESNITRHFHNKMEYPLLILPNYDYSLWKSVTLKWVHNPGFSLIQFINNKYIILFQ